MDTKDRVKIGSFSRNRKCRYAVEGAYNDFGDEFITLFGIPEGDWYYQVRVTD